MLRDFYKKLINKIKNSKTNLFIFLAICFLMFVLFLDLFDTNFKFHDILVESHGLVFDLFIFGILLTAYESNNNKKEKIERYKEELDDYRFWESIESMYRTRGIINRLVNLGEKNLDLSFCYLATNKSFHKYRDMKNWKFSGAILTQTYFSFSDMSNTDFVIANLQDSKFQNVNLTDCNFSNSNLNNVQFFECKLKNLNIENAIVNDEKWFDTLSNNKNLDVDILIKKYSLVKTDINDQYSLKKN
jgi:uncharacterized protein YjbI with pentapeptide repeats